MQSQNDQPVPTSAYTIDKLFDVNRLVTVITGGGTGIGLYITQAMAANGAKVYILGRRGDVYEHAADEHSKEAKGSITFVQADQTDENSLQQAVKQIGDKEGRVDLLIVNAGLGGKFQDIQKVMDTGKDFDGALKEMNKMTKEDASELFSTNIFGYYKTSLAFAPLLKKSSETQKDYASQVIFITSNASVNKIPMNQILYSASKAATTHLGRIFSVLFADAHIRFNILMPGLFPSELVAGRDKHDPESNQTLFEGTGGQDIPAGRPGRPQEMGAAIVGLASRSSMYVNGTTHLVDGGALLKVPSTY